VRAPRSTWIAGGAIVASVAISGLLLVWGLESLLPSFGIPSVVWLVVALLPLYCLWRKVGGQSALELRQIGLVVVAVVALDAALDAVVWSAKVALFAAAIVLVWAARRRAAAVGNGRP
jgi:hypothetical protein